MNSIDFCFWLQGVFEVADLKSLNEAQVRIVRGQLSLVFKHVIDPLLESQTTTPKAELDATHSDSMLEGHPIMRC